MAASGAPLPVRLRPASAGDAPGLAAINRAARAAAMPGLREPHDTAAVARWLSAVLMARHRVLLAETDWPLGYIGFGCPAGQGLWVFDLYIAPEHWRQGIGARLLGAALANEAGPVHLHCFARNGAARRFYEAHGFRADSFGDGTTNEEGEPDVLYVRPPGVNGSPEGANP